MVGLASLEPADESEEALPLFGDGAELPAIDVRDRLLDLLDRVHHEGTVLDDRLIDGFSRKENDVRLFPGGELETIAVVGEENELARARRGIARRHLSLGDDGER